MNEAFKKEVVAEIDTVFKSFGNVAANYLKIRDNYRFQLSIGVYDILRSEICKCIMMGLYQSSITLTNHLLEKFLKLSLIHNKTGFKYLNDINSAQDDFIEGANIYMSKDLEQTINMACSNGIITKDEKKQLIVYKNALRNPYGHADSNKLFGDETINVAYGNFDGTPKITSETIKIANFPMLHGEAQEVLASKQAVPYFRYIDHLVCREEIKKYPEIMDHSDGKKVP